MLITDFFREQVAQGVKPMIAYTALCQSLAKNGTMDEFRALTNEYQTTTGSGLNETTNTELINA